MCEVLASENNHNYHRFLFKPHGPKIAFIHKLNTTLLNHVLRDSHGNNVNAGFCINDDDSVVVDLGSGDYPSNDTYTLIIYRVTPLHDGILDD